MRGRAVVVIKDNERVFLGMFVEDEMQQTWFRSVHENLYSIGRRLDEVTAADLPFLYQLWATDGQVVVSEILEERDFFELWDKGSRSQ